MREGIHPKYYQAKEEHSDLKVVSHPNFSRGYEVLVCEPRSYDESVDILKEIIKKRLSLELMNRELTV